MAPPTGTPALSGELEREVVDRHPQIAAPRDPRSPTIRLAVRGQQARPESGSLRKTKAQQFRFRQGLHHLIDPGIGAARELRW
jgi:hypothetical protein